MDKVIGIIRPVKRVYVIPLYRRVNATFSNEDVHFTGFCISIHDILNCDVQSIVANWSKTSQDSIMCPY